MNLLTQEPLSLDADIEASEVLIVSNFSQEERLSSIERLRRGLITDEKIKEIDIYQEYPKVHELSESEIKGLLKLTFKLGNQLFYDDKKENKKYDFKHEYSLRYIELDASIITEIERQEKSVVYF